MVIDDGTQSVAKTVKQFRQIEGVFVPAGRLSEISELKCEPSTSWLLHRARTIENVSREDPDMINSHGLNRLTQSFFKKNNEDIADRGDAALLLTSPS